MITATALRAQEAPAAGQPTEQDAALDPAGDATPQSVPEPSPAPEQEHDPALAAATAQGERLRKAFTVEAQVQAFERGNLGQQDPETLSEYKRKHWQRVHDDEEAAQQPKTFVFAPLVLPDQQAIAEAGLTPDQRLLLARLERAYRASRTERDVVTFTTNNERFLKSYDWPLRDQAVRLREAIIERESAYVRMVDLAQRAVHEGLEDEEWAELKADLERHTPETVEGGADRVLLVLNDEQVRRQVLVQLAEALRDHTDEPPPQPPEETAQQLQPRVTVLQQQLVTEAGLVDVIAEHMALDVEIAALDEQLEDEQSERTLEERKELLHEKIARVRRSQELAAEWRRTRPDEELYEQLVDAQDALLRRTMFDLGALGALFGDRYAGVRALADAQPDDPFRRWDLIEAQQQLLSDIIDVRPEAQPWGEVLPRPPLHGMTVGKQAAQIAPPSGGPARATPAPTPKPRSDKPKSGAGKPPPKKPPKKKAGAAGVKPR